MSIPKDITLNKEANLKFDEGMEIRDTNPDAAALKFTEAIDMYKEVFTLREERIPLDVSTSNPIYNIANCYTNLYKLNGNDFNIKKAEFEMYRAIKLRTKLGDTDSIALSQMKGNLGQILYYGKFIEESIILLKDNATKHVEELGAHKETLEAIKMYQKAALESKNQVEHLEYIGALLEKI